MDNQPPAYETDDLPENPDNTAEGLTRRKVWVDLHYEESSNPSDPHAPLVDRVRKFELREMVAAKALGEFTKRIIALETRTHDEELRKYVVDNNREDGTLHASLLFAQDWANLALWLLSLRPQPGGLPSVEWLTEHAGVDWCSALVDKQATINRGQNYLQGNANRLLQNAGAKWGAGVLMGTDPDYPEFADNMKLCDELQKKKDDARKNGVLPLIPPTSSTGSTPNHGTDGLTRAERRKLKRQKTS